MRCFENLLAERSSSFMGSLTTYLPSAFYENVVEKMLFIQLFLSRVIEIARVYPLQAKIKSTDHVVARW